MIDETESVSSSFIESRSPFVGSQVSVNTSVSGTNRYRIAIVAQLNEFLENKSKGIADLCAQFDVERLELFGSALRRDFVPGQSDLDLLVQFKSTTGYRRVDAYFDLRDALRTLLGQEIDLVMVGAVRNKYISEEIERTKQLVYAA